MRPPRLVVEGGGLHSAARLAAHVAVTVLAVVLLAAVLAAFALFLGGHPAFL